MPQELCLLLFSCTFSDKCCAQPAVENAEDILANWTVMIKLHNIYHSERHLLGYSAVWLNLRRTVSTYTKRNTKCFVRQNAALLMSVRTGYCHWPHVRTCTFVGFSQTFLIAFGVYWLNFSSSFEIAQASQAESNASRTIWEWISFYWNPWNLVKMVQIKLLCFKGSCFWMILPVHAGANY